MDSRRGIKKPWKKASNIEMWSISIVIYVQAQKAHLSYVKYLWIMSSIDEHFINGYSDRVFMYNIVIIIMIR